MTTATHATSATITGAPRRVNWGVAIAFVYALFAAATTTFVIFAIGQPVDLVSPDYYERSLTVDDHLRAVKNAERLGAALRIDAAADGRGIDIAMPPRAAGEITGTVALYRPSNAAADRTIPLHPDSSGHQHVALDGSSRGRWRVQMQWTLAGRPFYYEQAVQLP